MPVLNLSNNQLLPPNQRAADVAAKAVEGIAKIQQQKINAAFHVQGAIVQDGLAAQAFADAFYLQDNFVHAFFTPCCVFLAMLPTVPAE